ncbi:MAG: nitroreductase family protein [Crocinitomicaceae bacterium]|nr:nitroreductase family protein [Crocinitomicaceae bacterium]
MNKDIISALEWRYAVKKFDATKKLSDIQIDRILDGLRLTATSMGMQLMKFIVITDPMLKEKIQPIAFGQTQITDCSHLIVLCRTTEPKQQHIEDIIELTAQKRNMEKNTKQLIGYGEMMKYALHMPRQEQINWLENQVYLAMGNLLTICAVEEVDCCPMEGFNKSQLDDFLGLPEKGLNSVLMCTLGYRADDDKYGHLSKIRRNKEDLVEKLSLQDIPV